MKTPLSFLTYGFLSQLRRAYLVACAVLITLAGLAWNFSHNAANAARWLSHTHEVLDQIAEVRGDTYLVEMTTQYFRVSGDPARLLERDAVMAKRATALQKIKQLTLDNPTQQAQWQKLQDVISQRVAISQRTEVLRKTEGEAAAAAFVATAPIKETRERLLGLLDAMQQIENDLLAQRNSTLEKQSQYARVAGSLGAALLLALLTVTYWFSSQQMTAMSRSEQALARFKGTLDQTLDCIFMIDPVSLHFLYTNLGAQQQVGYSADELLHMTPLQIKPEFSEASYRAMMAPLLEGREHAVRFETRHLHKDGHQVPVEMFFQIVHSDAHGPVCVAVAHDITERKQVERELITAKTTAEQANQAKDSFLATMSHEIRTPLGGLMGMLELLSLSKLEREQMETLQAARDSGRSLLRILNDILDWSKIQEGKLELAEQPVALVALVAEVANTYSHVASGNSVTISTQVDARLSSALRVDPLRLSQVLNNFVSNAIKFNHGGRVQIRAELLEELDGAQRVRFAVQDSGIGMAPEVLQHLFERYAQGSADTARMYGGTGLGLAICRRLADLLDGHIEVQSELGQGSTFSITLTLPLAQTAAQDLLGEPGTGSAAGAFAPFVARAPRPDAPRVLVVDDHPLNRKLLARQLGLLGLNADTADNGQVALEMWRRGGYALVISDCHMPVLDGYALTRAIRAAEAAQGLPRLPVFAWTANALPDEIDNCAAAGMDELLVKPAELPQLQSVLAQWLALPSASPVQPELEAQPDPDSSAPPEPSSVEGGAAAKPAALDVSVLAALVGDDPAVIAEFLQDFAASAKTIATELRVALADGHAAVVGALAHKLKSSARSVGALALGELCEQLEQAGKAAQLDALPALMQRFEAELTPVMAELPALIKQNQPVTPVQPA